MIMSAIQKGNYVYVYNEKNLQIGCRNGTLVGYTSSSVSVKQGAYVYTYNEKMLQISCRFVG
ncbi:MAG: hypothetical protein ILO64_01405 [Clostridia bacterium]|nr:hypothetical protein [Clostridia bacterium]MBP5657339.1 hypothetical protein [Clostridia bacterium]